MGNLGKRNTFSPVEGPSSVLPGIEWMGVSPIVYDGERDNCSINFSPFRAFFKGVNALKRFETLFFAPHP